MLEARSGAGGEGNAISSLGLLQVSLRLMGPLGPEGAALNWKTLCKDGPENNMHSGS